MGYALLDTVAEDLLTDLTPELLKAGLVDLRRDIARVFDPTRPLDHQQCVGIIRKLFGSIALVTLIGEGERLDEFCIMMREEVVDKLHDQIESGGRNQEELFPLIMIDLALALGFYVAEAERSLSSHGEIPKTLVGEMLRTVCNSHEWAQNVMRLVDWFSVLLTRRWQFQGASGLRLRQFIKNYDEGVVDYLELSPLNADGDREA